MSPEEILDCRYELEYRAEYSIRYHRRRAAFLKNLDTLLTLVTITAGAATFGELVSGSPGWLAKLGAAMVTMISLAQVLLRLGPHGSAHAEWMKRWTKMQTDIRINTTPTENQIKGWVAEKGAIETECVGELRALCFDCEDAAARVMKIPDRQHQIVTLQRLFIHFGTFQRTFPKAPD